MTISGDVRYKNWGESSKITARNDTIVEIYHKITKNKHLPMDKEYWTMCGRCVDITHTLIKGCEFDHMTSLNIITPQQFHGVERDKNIARLNMSMTSGHWYQGDFITTLSQYAKNPGIINFDAPQTPILLGRKDNVYGLVSLLKEIQLMDVHECLLIVNMTLQCSWHKLTIDDYIYLLQPAFKIHPLWVDPDQEYNIYCYPGTGGNIGTTMITGFFWYP